VVKFSELLTKKKRDVTIIFFLLIFIPLFLFALNRYIYLPKTNNIVNRTEQSSLGAKTAKITNIPSPSPTQNVISPSPATSPNNVYLGMWTEGFWNESTYTLHPEALTSLQNRIGKKVAIAHYYRGWENLGRESIITELQTINNNGWRPMISANPYFFNQCLQNGNNIYKTIAEGGCDKFLEKIGNNFKLFGQPVFLRFAWEMNIDAIEWSIQKTGSTPEDYVQAWRRFRDIVKSQGASNVIWVWSPNVSTGTSIPYASLYPGDAYVDWLGLDGYNWGTSQAWSQWQSFSQIYSSSYNTIAALAPSKPIMIAEVNTTDVGGSKAAWYQDMLATQIPYNYPRVKAVVFYNENRSQKEKVNWLIDITPTSFETFSKYIKNNVYLSSF
jgi:beta-mannanase